MDTEALKRFGESVRNLRISAKMTGSDLAASVNSTRDDRDHVSKSYISDIENGRRQPREEVTREIARVLGFDANTLVLLSGRVPTGMDIGKVMAAQALQGDGNGRKGVQGVQGRAAGKGNGSNERRRGGSVRKGRRRPAHKADIAKDISRARVGARAAKPSRKRKSAAVRVN